MPSDTVTKPDRLAGWVNVAPVILMSAGWCGPLSIFWLQAFGPLRPFQVAPVPAPNGWVFVLSLLACASAWWLPRAYYKPRSFERTGRLYELLGVRLFRRFVPDGDIANSFRRRGERTFRHIQHRQSAIAFLEHTEMSEKSHVVLLLMGMATTAWAVRIGWMQWASFITIGNVLINLYPILLQRYTRARILRATASRSVL